ncbi:hypothetical protein APASM_0863 [Actinosynnema pretiosum subsp. pretiosum]|nr:hypothetical protein APASM_0863 [Actinosynnema pretiosum subsp. pretiosum]
MIIFWPDHSLHFSEDQETALRFLALMEGVRADELHLTERGGPPTSGDNASTTSDSAPTERRQPS